MRLFRLVLALLFISYLLPAGSSGLFTEDLALKAAVHDYIQTLPASESIGARTLYGPGKKLLSFIFSLPTRILPTQQELVWLSEKCNQLHRQLNFTANQSRAPPV